MRPQLPAPTTYLITAGRAAERGAASGDPVGELLSLVRSAVAGGVSLVQLREKHLSTRLLYDLASRAAALTRGTGTLLLVNDRADVARAAGCDGVHLTTVSLECSVVRRAFGQEFVVGVSAHTLTEARAARDGGADFATFGPVYDTPSKRAYGPPVGLEALREAAAALAGFPLVALGGVSEETVAEVLGAGAAGVAGIRMFAEARDINRLVKSLHGGDG